MRLLSTLQVRAVDGDTIRVAGERIRLRGIGTPVMSELQGPSAKRRLEELLRSGSIRIVPHGRDVYDRLVADVFVNEKSVAEMLVREGYEKRRSQLLAKSHRCRTHPSLSIARPANLNDRVTFLLPYASYAK